jgi:hypothetical protein
MKKTELRSLRGGWVSMGESNAISIQQVDPVFSYTVDGAFRIHIYVVKTKVSTIAIATFDDSNSEVTYAVQTLTTGSKYEVGILLMNAEENFNDNENNPFHTLLWDSKALGELYRVVKTVVKGG